MSRSGYNEDGDIETWVLIRWRGAVKSAIRGRRGQAFLKELLAALDDLPKPELIAHDLIKDGGVCAIGSVGLSRGTDMTGLDPEFSDGIAASFGIANALVCEIEFINDEDFYPGLANDPNETIEHRFTRVRSWVEKQIR